MPVIKSKHSDVEIPEDISFADFIFDGVHKHEDKTALIDHISGEEITYGSLYDKVNRLACALHERGLRKGDVICVFMDKSIVGAIVVFAIFKLGAVMTPSRPSHLARELATQLNSSKSKALIADKKLMDIAEAAVKDSPSIQHIFTFGEVTGYESIEEMIQKTNGTLLHVEINPKTDLLALIYSSGTTGLPKGVMLSHYNLLSNAIIMGDPKRKYFTRDTLQTAPPFHIAGLVFLSVTFHLKHLAVLCSPSSAVECLKIGKKYNIRSLFITGNFLTEITKLPQEAINQVGVDLSNTVFFTGGSVTPASCVKQVMAKTGIKSLIQGYGSTETVGFVTLGDEDNIVPGSVGLLLPNHQCKIKDVSTGKLLGPMEQGELLIKGPGITLGYLNNPKATEEAIVEDGWLRMGDIGYYDDSEHIFIVDRIKDFIKYQSMQVAPSEIEDVIYFHPAVKSVCVVPVEDESAGEVPLACVIVKDGHSATEEEIMKLVAGEKVENKTVSRK